MTKWTGGGADVAGEGPVPGASSPGPTDGDVLVKMVIIDNKDKAWTHEILLPRSTPLITLKHISKMAMKLMTDDSIEVKDLDVYSPVDSDTRTLGQLKQEKDILVIHRDAMEKIRGGGKK